MHPDMLGIPSVRIKNENTFALPSSIKKRNFPQPMSITTKSGDTGETGLMFSKRTRKDDPRICACGNVDELNAAIGLAKAQLFKNNIHDQLDTIQRTLINLMGEIATTPSDKAKYANSAFKKLTTSNIKMLDEWINTIESQGLTFKDWAIPGNNIQSAQLDFARTVCRRAERSIVSLLDQKNNEISQPIIYLNRLSDLLWLMARSVEHPQKSDPIT